MYISYLTLTESRNPTSMEGLDQESILFELLSNCNCCVAQLYLKNYFSLQSWHLCLPYTRRLRQNLKKTFKKTNAWSPLLSKDSVSASHWGFIHRIRFCKDWGSCRVTICKIITWFLLRTSMEVQLTTSYTKYLKDYQFCNADMPSQRYKCSQRCRPLA